MSVPPTMNWISSSVGRRECSENEGAAGTMRLPKKFAPGVGVEAFLGALPARMPAEEPESTFNLL